MDKLPKRKNHRLTNFDYGGYGYYYVTVCTRNRIKILSDIVASDSSDKGVLRSDEGVAPYEVVPTMLGKMIIECWKNIALLNENVEVDKFVLMPNHIHGIIIIKNTQPIEQEEKIYI